MRETITDMTKGFVDCVLTTIDKLTSFFFSVAKQAFIYLI